MKKSIEERAKEWSGFKDSHSSIQSVCLKNGYIKGAHDQYKIDKEEIGQSFAIWVCQFIHNRYGETIDLDSLTNTLMQTIN